MSDDDLRPIDPSDLVQALAHGLRFDGRRRLHYADDHMARIAAEHLVRHLQQSGLVVMRKPAAPNHAAPFPYAPKREGEGEI